MPTPEQEAQEINKEMQRRFGRHPVGRWTKCMREVDLDAMAEKHPAVKEKLEELAAILKLCR